MEKILRYEQPEFYSFTETYYNVEVLHTLASLNVSIDGYNEIEDGLYRENVISLKRMQKNYLKRSNENRLEYEKTFYNKGRYWLRGKESEIYGLQNVYNKVRRLLMDGFQQLNDLLYIYNVC